MEVFVRNSQYILITGASSGIGRQCAIQLSNDYNLILCARREDKLEETKSLCQNNDKHLIFTCDLSDVISLEEKLVDFIKDKQITINKFVHCAGALQMQPIKTVDVETIMSEFSTNLVSSALIVKTLINKRKNQSALDNVVFISSNISNRGAKAFSIYSATKSGLDGLMRSLSVELAPKVRVNSVLPGGIPTEMTKAIYAENGNSKEHLYPLGYGKPHYIADAVEFLLSNKSKWITGQQIVVDGGRTIDITE